MTEHKLLFRGFHLDGNGKTTITLNGNQFNGDWLYWNKWGECINIENGALILLPAQGFECLRVNKFNILHETIGQWVATDKNGKDVFEGDILQGEAEEAHGIVEWQQAECRYLVNIKNGYDWLFMDDDKWTVIGNKWEMTTNE